MNGKKITRVVLDVALTAMIIAEMFIQFTGVFLHEVIGFAFFATVVTHLALSAKWIKNTASSAKDGKMTGRRTALAVMGVLLAINMVVLGASSVAISTILASAGFTWALGSYAVWSAIHSVSSYTLCALVTVHLGMHWAFLASAFRVPYDPSRRRAINTGVHAAAAVGALALGVMAVNQVSPLTASGNGNGNGNGYGAGNGTGSGTGAQSRNGNAFNSVNDVQESNGSSSAESSASGKHKGKTKGMSSGKADAAGSSTSPDASAQESTPQADSSAGQGSAETYGAPDQGGYGESNDGSSSSASGICTLCRKQCPLSAPQCNKPYAAGLI